MRYTNRETLAYHMELLEASIQNGNKQTPVEIQLAMFGLTPRALKSIEGKNVLDVACGNGSLVKHLRSNNIIAEGIDSAAPENDVNFMKRNIVGMGLISGIPKPNGTYDLILGFQNSVLNTAFSTDKMEEAILLHGSKEGFFSCCLMAQATVHEMIRTLKPGGRVMIFPGSEKIKEVMHLSLLGSNVSFSEEKIDKRLLRSWSKWELGTNFVSDIELGYLNTRTVIEFTKK